MFFYPGAPPPSRRGGPPGAEGGSCGFRAPWNGCGLEGWPRWALPRRLGLGPGVSSARPGPPASFLGLRDLKCTLACAAQISPGA